MYAEQLMSLGIVKKGQVINQDTELEIIRGGLKVKHARKVMKEMAMSSGEWVALIGLSHAACNAKAILTYSRLPNLKKPWQSNESSTWLSTTTAAARQRWIGLKPHR